MNKSQVVAKLAEVKEITIKEATHIMDTIMDIIEAEIVSGGEVALHGFGTLKTVERVERAMINPQTKEKMIVPAKKTVTFKVAKGLKDKVNN